MRDSDVELRAADEPRLEADGVDEDENDDDGAGHNILPYGPQGRSSRVYVLAGVAVALCVLVFMSATRAAGNPSPNTNPNPNPNSNRNPNRTRTRTLTVTLTGRLSNPCPAWIPRPHRAGSLGSSPSPLQWI